jgi:hypothetical protein
MVAAVAAAAVVVKNARLFIVTSLAVLRNLANVDQDTELPPATRIQTRGMLFGCRQP